MRLREIKFTINETLKRLFVAIRVHFLFKFVSSGFTLIEILIAATIFATVMVMATGTIAQTTAFRGKIREARLASEDARRSVSTISEDIKAVRSGSKIVLPGEAAGSTITLTKGVALLSCDLPGRIARCVAKTSYGDADTANVLILASSDGYTIYISRENMVFKKKYTGAIPDYSNMTALTGALNGIVYAPLSNAVLADNRLSYNNLSSSINFSGLLCATSPVCTGQPYVHFTVTSQSVDYANLPVSQRATATIRSMVTSRSDN